MYNRIVYRRRFFASYHKITHTPRFMVLLSWSIVQSTNPPKPVVGANDFLYLYSNNFVVVDVVVSISGYERWIVGAHLRLEVESSHVTVAASSTQYQHHCVLLPISPNIYIRRDELSNMKGCRIFMMLKWLKIQEWDDDRRIWVESNWVELSWAKLNWTGYGEIYTSGKRSRYNIQANTFTIAS